MSKTGKVQEGKAQLSALLAEVEHSDEAVLVRGDVSVTRLVPIGDAPQRELGLIPFDVPESFFDPLPADEVGAWQQ